jgi:hypothetical protein
MKKALFLVGALVAVFFIVGFVSGNTPEGKERARQRAVISLCWDDQRKASNGPAGAQFIASVCEKKEQEYKDRWNNSP